MRHSMPMRWIEQAEANEVLTAARFERPQRASWCSAMRRATAAGLDRVRAWVAPGEQSGWPLLQAQPALVRRPVCRPRRLSEDDDRICRW